MLHNATSLSKEIWHHKQHLLSLGTLLVIINVENQLPKKNKSCQKPTIEIAGWLREKLNISPLDIGHE